MKEIANDAGLVAYCGLYCGACRAFLKEHCPGCAENDKAKWCKIRLCCRENDYRTCADCGSYMDVNDCTKFNNFISRLFAVIFRSNRKGCIEEIRNTDIRKYAALMAEKKTHSLKRI